MIAKDTSSPFVDPVAVEAWDTWFRWRERGRLRDVTVDATWERVSNALVQGLPEDERREAGIAFLQAFRTWEILVDERVLASAGTDVPNWPEDWLSVVVNVASFVRDPRGGAYVDLAALQRAAALAVKLADLAAWRAGAPTTRVLHHRIGIVGFGDALKQLKIDYDSVAALRLLAQVGSALRRGTTIGSIQQARSYGGLVRYGEECSSAWLRQLPPSLRDEGEAIGFRHATLTAISPQPRLALFANCVADGIEPAQAALGKVVGTGRESRDYVLGTHAGHETEVRPKRMLPDMLAFARHRMVAAIQPWLDQPMRSAQDALGRRGVASNLQG
jgi:ribonucleoside-diphosphate reductase alpha chain